MSPSEKEKSLQTESNDMDNRFVDDGTTNNGTTKAALANHVALVNDDSPHKTKVDSSNMDENQERGNWSNHLDFMLSCVSYAVGLGNVWRFPYLCFSNGGGAFLIPYIIMLVFAGMPLFFLELSFGQYGSSGPISCWRSVPLFRGVGYGMVIVSALVAVYYNVIICYTIFYIIKSMTTGLLPWVGCNHDWNSPFCSTLVQDCLDSDGIVTQENECIPIVNMTSAEMMQYNITADGNITNYKDPLMHLRVRPSEEYYRQGVLHDSGDIFSSGYVIWQLALCLLLAWLLVFICLAKGVKSSGKVVYFTAIFPYVVLFILLIRGVTLDGYMDGVKFFITPQWELLKHPKVWKDAAVQIFYSLSASWGGLITLSSYNKFHNNCFRDAMIVPVINCATSIFAGFVIFSIMGNMAYELKVPVSEVVDEEFGLAFIAYPEAVARLPISPLWSLLFFFMLLTLGLGSQLCIVETVVTSIVDEFPRYLRSRKVWVLGVYATLGFLLGLNCVTQAGNYWVILMDKYAADFALLIFGLCECIGMGWFYGVRRFFNDIRTMISDRLVDNVFFKWWGVLWCALTPAILSFVLLFNWIDWEVPMAGENKPFPPGAHVIGWIMIMSSISAIPACMIYELIKADGSLRDRFRQATTSHPSWGPALKTHRLEAMNVHKSHGTEMGGVLEPDSDKYADNDVKYSPANADESMV
ncbi:sodium- and chloride-dependent glycine transporter 1-like isoform X1 [Asterias rubens]|uniref:sodium- and chloride-dependent glycine transporter 1-like isoform X1 n=1 Tax=Asterias rubens TaxID=7604 RepID=UPI00145552AB|nr:sodium- and chloride-dependent glycine transporter 1-like isoform X1 [Asterias rubens]